MFDRNRRDFLNIRVKKKELKNKSQERKYSEEGKVNPKKIIRRRRSKSEENNQKKKNEKSRKRKSVE